MSAEQRAALMAEVEQIVNEGRYATAKDVAAKHGLSALRFKYGARETFDRLVCHSRSVRRARSEAKHEAQRALARKTVRQLFAVSTYLTRRSVNEAIEAAGLSMLSPTVRHAALAELQRLREGAVIQRLVPS